MAYLHENKEEFANAVNLASLKYHILPEVAEKDYYVTMILRELSARLPFIMKVQSLDRTLADKVFAICDYHLENRTAKHSRHIYDIFKLLPLVPQTEQFRLLVKEVREERAKNNICPSAKPGVNVPALLSDIVSNQIYKSDYEMITSKLLEEDVSYQEAIEAIRKIAGTNMFSE